MKRREIPKRIFVVLECVKKELTMKQEHRHSVEHPVKKNTRILSIESWFSL